MRSLGFLTLFIGLLLKYATAFNNNGPVMGGINFPDPSIIWADGKWYAFATRTIGSQIHIQVASSPDYQHWTLMQDNGQQYDALPKLPSWVDKENFSTWAPDVNQLDDGTFIMYYAAHLKDTEYCHCVGAATSQNVTGPYTVTSDKPLICPEHKYGPIDPNGFKDWETKGDWTLPGSSQHPKDRFENSYLNPTWSQGGKGGRRYITWKGDDVGDGASTPMMLQEVNAADGVTLLGSPMVLFNNDGDSDHWNLEGPSIVKTADGKTYYLFFSRGDTCCTSYTVSYATAPSVQGPWTRKGDLLTSQNTGLRGPGGMDVHWDGVHMLFHAVPQPPGEKFKYKRDMYAALVSISDQGVSVESL